MNYYDDLCSTSKQANNMSAGSYPQMQYSTMPSNIYPQMNQAPLPTMPTGIPGGGIVGQLPMPQSPGGTTMADMGTPEVPTDSVQFVAGFLRTQIGKNMRVEFLIGTGGPLVDRLGTLVAVGTSFILLRPYGSKETIMCDLYSIRFVTIFPDGTNATY